MSDLLDAALGYAARGWHVFPVKTRSKLPLVKWGTLATADVTQITAWWKQWPDANIGIATGARSGMVVLDVDGEEGRQTIGGQVPMPATMIATTGRGDHVYFQHPGFPVHNFVKRDGLDFRGDGGYVVAPPSLHENGTHYDWLDAEHEPTPLPDWLLAMLLPEPEPPAPLPVIAPPSTRTEQYAVKALEGELTKLSQCSNGTRNDQLNKSSFALGQIVAAGWMEAAYVADALLGTAQAVGLPKSEARATIKSGMLAGSKEPRVLTDRPLDTDPAHGLVIKGKGPVSPGERGAAADDANWLHKGVTADKLQHKLFAQVNWPVANILSEGCTLLAGKPKSKKSWLALGIGADVARGVATLGGLDTRPGRVLYLDLESNQRRMQQRLRALLGNEPWPSNFHIFTDWPKGAEGIARLDAWMLAYPDTILVICDILQNVRPARTKNANPYDEDYEAVQPLNAFGERHHCAVIAIHHTRKAKADDVFDEISGSTGLVAGVAGMWIIGRQPNSPQSVLSIRGRDIVIDDDMILMWNDYKCRFELDDTAEGRIISQERREVYAAFSDEGVHSPKDLAETLRKSLSIVNKHLSGLFADGLIDKVGYGKYQKVLGKKYGLDVPDGKDSSHSSHTPHSGETSHSSEQNGAEPGQSVPNSAESMPTMRNSPYPLRIVGSASQSPKTPENANYADSPYLSSTSTEIQHLFASALADKRWDAALALIPQLPPAAQSLARQELHDAQEETHA